MATLLAHPAPVVRIVRSWLVVLALLLALDASARIPRSTTERYAFVKENACPVSGRNRLPCPGHEIDHVVPLCAGGADHRSNMQWLTVAEHKAKTKADVRACRTR